MKTRLFHCLVLAVLAAVIAYGVQHFVLAGEVDPQLVYFSAGAGAIVGLLFGHGLSEAFKAIINIR